MLKGIPWEIIGPASGVLIILLVIIFKFMLKWQKGTKTPITPSNPPRTINDTQKKSLCMDHHRDIGKNQTAIEMIGEQLKTSQEQNSEQHGKIFDKMEEMGKDIIKEIHKANGDG